MNVQDLQGKNILITGASRGIGKAICLYLARQKAHVLFTYRGSSDKAQPLVKAIQDYGGQATPLHLDLANPKEDIADICLKVKELGELHGLVNNAGISKDQLMLRLKEADLDEILTVNLKSAIMLTSSLTRYLMKTPHASIVNVSSVVALMGNASQLAYSSSKAGMIGMTKSIAKELAGKGVRCNAICPGFIETDMTDGLSEERKEAYLTEIPLKRMGSVSDVANVVGFLLSESSSYITGEVIKIDGGLYI